MLKNCFFFLKNYQQTAEELSLSARKGNTDAIKAYAEFGLHLGECIKSILYLYAPEAIILGGSISKSFSLFKESMELSLQTFAYQKQIENLNANKAASEKELLLKNIASLQEKIDNNERIINKVSDLCSVFRKKYLSWHT